MVHQVIAQLTLPITSASQLHAKGLDTMKELFADSVGWNEIPGQVVKDLRRSAGV